MTQDSPIDSPRASALASSHVEFGNNQSCQIAEHALQLRTGTDAICRLSGGEPTFEEGRKIFTEFCDQNDFWCDHPLCCHSEPDAHGDEHEVWFVGEHVFKLTFPDFYGLRVVYRADGDQRCLPCEYFERWNLHNRIFGDDVELLGAVRTIEGPRILMRQKAILGAPASLEQISEFFLGNGWQRFEIDRQVAWYDEHQSLVVSDTHQGNLILTPDGILIPIDFRIQTLDGALHDAVRAQF